MRKRQKSTQMRRGVSLIEVLIVLVVLTLGILTIIRLFPGGFETIRTVQNSTVADRIGEAAIQSLVQNNSAMPDAILTGYTYNANYDNDLDGAIQNGMFVTDGSDPDNAKLLNNTRYISNETITIPSSGVYVVNYGPIDTTAQGFFVKGLPWTAETNDSAGSFQPSDLPAGQQVFAVDYVNGKIGVPTTTFDEPNCELTVDGGLHYVNFTLKAVNSGQWLDAATINAFSGVSGTLAAGPWTPGQVAFRRIFHSVSTFTGDPDPYGYALTNSNILPSSGPSANVGGIRFNPAAGGGNGSKPLKAQISYTAYDWSIIHEDRDVPGSTSSSSPLGSPVRLSLSHLKEIGYLQTNNKNYSGVIPNTNMPMIVVDLDTGLAANISYYQINYGSGLVTLSSAYNGSRVRIYYAAENDWAVAMQKAPRAYQWKTTAFPLAATDSVPAITYEVDTTNAIAYFPRCDAGKTIEIDGIPTTAGSATSLTTSLPQADKINNYISLNLASLVSNIGALTATTTTPPFTSVRGLSARAFVAYRERDGNYRMRTVDTVLARTP